MSTDDVIRSWIRAAAHLDTQRRNVDTAADEELNARRIVAQALMPADARPGEKIAVWHGDTLIQVHMIDGGEPTATIRSTRKP